MTWTPDRFYRLERARRSIAPATNDLLTVIEDIPDSPQRESLIAANERLAGALELIQEVIEHAKTVREFTQAVEQFTENSGGK